MYSPVFCFYCCVHIWRWLYPVALLCLNPFFLVFFFGGGGQTKKKKKPNKSSPQLHFYRLQFSGRGRQDQVPEQDGPADHLQRHAGQCLPEKEVNVTLATSRSPTAPPASERVGLPSATVPLNLDKNQASSVHLTETKVALRDFRFRAFVREDTFRLQTSARDFKVGGKKAFCYRLGEKEERERRRRHWTVFRFTKK